MNRAVSSQRRPRFRLQRTLVSRGCDVSLAELMQAASNLSWTRDPSIAISAHAIVPTPRWLPRTRRSGSTCLSAIWDSGARASTPIGVAGLHLSLSWRAHPLPGIRRAVARGLSLLGSAAAWGRGRAGRSASAAGQAEGRCAIARRTIRVLTMRRRGGARRGPADAGGRIGPGIGDGRPLACAPQADRVGPGAVRSITIARTPTCGSRRLSDAWPDVERVDADALATAAKPEAGVERGGAGAGEETAGRRDPRAIGPSRSANPPSRPCRRDRHGSRPVFNGRSGRRPNRICTWRAASDASKLAAGMSPEDPIRPSPLRVVVSM